jgi:tRNA/rRNA methyltransferase
MSSHSVGRTLHEANPNEVESLMSRIEDSLRALDLPTRLSVERLMLRLRKISGRAQLEREDVNMLHGLVKELARKLEKANH